MDNSPFVEASFYLLLRIDRSCVAKNGQNGHITKLLRLNQCVERGEGVYKLRRLPEKITIDDHLHLSSDFRISISENQLRQDKVRILVASLVSLLLQNTNTNMVKLSKYRKGALILNLHSPQYPIFLIDYRCL